MVAGADITNKKISLSIVGCTVHVHMIPSPVQTRNWAIKTMLPLQTRWAEVLDSVTENDLPMIKSGFI